jgi:hypothetical protein
LRSVSIRHAPVRVAVLRSLARFICAANIRRNRV